MSGNRLGRLKWGTGASSRGRSILGASVAISLPLLLFAVGTGQEIGD